MSDVGCQMSEVGQLPIRLGRFQVRNRGSGQLQPDSLVQFTDLRPPTSDIRHPTSDLQTSVQGQLPALESPQPHHDQDHRYGKQYPAGPHDEPRCPE